MSHQNLKSKRQINQSIKEEDTQRGSTCKDTQKFICTISTSVSKQAPIPKQPFGEGWWVKPADSPYVEAVRTPKCTAKTTTWEPIAIPPKKISYLESLNFK